MGIHANSKDYELISANANIQKTMAANPRRVAAIRIDFQVVVSGGASDQALAVLEKVGRACPVARSLHPDLKQELRFSFERA